MSNVDKVLADILVERHAQDRKLGIQHHRDGTGEQHWTDTANAVKHLFEATRNDPNGGATWLLILWEEVAEAFAETDPTALRMELVQVGAVAAAWIEDIDWRGDPARAAIEPVKLWLPKPPKLIS